MTRKEFIARLLAVSFFIIILFFFKLDVCDTYPFELVGRQTHNIQLAVC